MLKEKKPVRFLLIFSAIVLFIFLVMQFVEVKLAGNIAILFPKGIIALKERNLLFVIQILMLFIIIPVYILTFFFSWKYNSHDNRGKYDPDLEDNKIAEYIWWGVPLIMTVVIGVLTWIRTYELDPYKPIASDKKALEIQVVALQWKWLFIYPEEGIATVNYLRIPEKRPLHFVITADAPMNSFWIPQLGGQIYAMPKMKTHLYLIADHSGDYRGSSANLSGNGFAGMHFIAKATSDEEFQKWISSTKETKETLDFKSYTELAKPSENNPLATYQLKDKNLFDQIIMKFMHPQKNT